MIQLNRTMSSTILADIKSKKTNKSTTTVRVGKLGIGKRTIVGNAHEYIDNSNTKVGNAYIEDPPVKVDSGTDTGVSESHILSKKITSSIGKAAGIAVVGSMIAGPPVVGYLLFGWVGLAVGSMVAGPFVMIFVWSLVT